MSTPYPSVVLIILTCNQRETTLQCLASLFACKYHHKTIILVDNGSEDHTLAAVKKEFPEVHCIGNEKNLGAATGRNIGIEYAHNHCEFEYVMFMDNDIVVTAGFLTKLVDGLRKHKKRGVEIATPKIYLMETDNIFDSAGGAKVNYYTGSTQSRGHGEKDVGQYDNSQITSLVPTTAVLMHKRALLRAKHFDVLFDPYGYEDLDMVIRANHPGSPFLFVAEAAVYHKGSRTGFGGYSTEYTKIKMVNLRQFLKRHATYVQWISFCCLLPLLALKSVARELKKGNISTVMGLIKGFMKSKRGT